MENDPALIQGLDYAYGGGPSMAMYQQGMGPMLSSSQQQNGPDSMPIDEFSTEDNQLLMSVLNSTPIDQQYSFYVPPGGGSVAVPPPWADLPTPQAAAAYTDMGMGAPQAQQQQSAGMDYGSYPMSMMQNNGMPQQAHANPANPTQPNNPFHPHGLPMHIKPDPGMAPNQMMYNSQPFPQSSMQMPPPQQTRPQPGGFAHPQQQPQAPLLPAGYAGQPGPQIVVTSPSDNSTDSRGSGLSTVERDESGSADESPEGGDGGDGEGNDKQRNKRRESQNRASRNYRQRKKQYIKEIEAKLEALRLENDQLRLENQRNRRLMTQFQAVLDKPAPLLRSFSSELMTEDQEIEKVVLQLSEAAQRKMDDNALRQLLDTFHAHTAKRQSILHKEAMQLVNPKMQERLVRLEGVPPRQVESQLGKWLQYVAQFVSQDQIDKLTVLKRQHLAQREAIWNERLEINRDIKEFYQEKLAGERLNAPGKLEQSAVLTLTSKLEQLKKNLARESELNNTTVSEFSNILTPYQEAIITIKHYAFYKDKLSAIHMLNNVWSVLSQKP